MKWLTASLNEGSTDIIGLGRSGFNGRVGFLAWAMSGLLRGECDGNDPKHKLDDKQDVSNLEEYKEFL